MLNHSSIHDGLQVILAHIIQDFMQFMNQTGLSRSQIHALLHIYHAGECPISDIRALTDSSPAAASQLVERLVQQGLVLRSEDPQNRRIKKLRLSAKSLELINQGVTSNRFLGELLASLSDSQRETVFTAFDYLAQASQQIHASDERKDGYHAEVA
ncbi:MAG TPA: MarR family winged helix-turn-helix transcriptional regulator [Anaerolineales bacterium]